MFKTEMLVIHSVSVAQQWPGVRVLIACPPGRRNHIMQRVFELGCYPTADKQGVMVLDAPPQDGEYPGLDRH